MEGHEYKDKSTGQTEGPRVKTEEDRTIEGVISMTRRVRDTQKGHEYDRNNTGHSKGS